MTRAASRRRLRSLVLLGYHASRGPALSLTPSFRSGEDWWGWRNGGVPLSVLCACNPENTEYTRPVAGPYPVRRGLTQPGVPCGWLAGHDDGVCRGHMDNTQRIGLGLHRPGESRGAMQGGARPSRTPLCGLAQAGLVDRIRSSHGRLPRILLGRVAVRPPACLALTDWGPSNAQYC